VHPGLDIEPLRQGGTGSFSEMDMQPRDWPDRMEAGTMNAPGAAGLLAALRWIREKTTAAIRAREVTVMQGFLDALTEMPGIEIYGPRRADMRVGLVCVNVGDKDPAAVAYELEQRGVLTRAGLHCAPWAHQAQHTLSRGAVRLSVGPFTTEDDLSTAAAALADIARDAAMIGS